MRVIPPTGHSFTHARTFWGLGRPSQRLELGVTMGPLGWGEKEVPLDPKSPGAAAKGGGPCITPGCHVDEQRLTLGAWPAVLDIQNTSAQNKHGLYFSQLPETK